MKVKTLLWIGIVTMCTFVVHIPCLGFGLYYGIVWLSIIGLILMGICLLGVLILANYGEENNPEIQPEPSTQIITLSNGKQIKITEL